MLKDKYDTLEEELESYKISHRRGLILRDKCFQTFPRKINGSITIDPCGKRLIRLFVYPEKELTEDQTIEIIQWLSGVCSENPERSVRKETGKIYWRCDNNNLEDKNGRYDELIIVENAHIQDCKVTKTKQDVTVFELDCNNK